LSKEISFVLIKRKKAKNKEISFQLFHDRRPQQGGHVSGRRQSQARGKGEGGLRTVGLKIVEP
jgi:hypothetical protein